MASLRRLADSRVRLPDLHHPRENRFFCPPLQHSCFQGQIKLELLLLLLSHFSHVRLCATPQTAAHQAPLSLGILQARTLEWVAIAFSKIGRMGFNTHSTENLSPALPLPFIYIIKFLVRKLKWGLEALDFNPVFINALLL